MRDISLYGLAWHHFDLFDDVSFHFHDVRQCNVVFSHQKLAKCIWTLLLQSKFLEGLFFHVMAENWKHLIFRRFFCVNQNRVLLTSELLPIISLVGGQSWSGYITRGQSKGGLDRCSVRGDWNLPEQTQQQESIPAGEGSNLRKTG